MGLALQLDGTGCALDAAEMARGRRLVDEALALERAGAFAVVAECVPATVGAALSRALAVPCVGIGAGPGCDGQVLVYSDLLGSLAHPHHASHVPRFCRVFAEVGKESRRGLAAFRDAVRTGAFPSDEYSPYAMSDAEAAAYLQRALEQRLRKQPRLGPVALAAPGRHFCSRPRCRRTRRGSCA